MMNFSGRFAVAAILALCSLSATAVSVAEGAQLFTNADMGCSGCHNPNTNLNHITNASNFPGAIAGVYDRSSSFDASTGPMRAQATKPNASQQLSLALYIGTFKAPIASDGSLALRPGTSATVDVYPLLASDGSGGVARNATDISASQGSHGTTQVTLSSSSTSIAYNIRYTPSAGDFVGSDSFSFKIANALGSSTKTIAVTVANTDPPTVSSVPSPLAATCDEPLAARITATNPPIVGYSATGLPKGLALNAGSGEITGKPQQVGRFTLQLKANNDVGTGTANVELVVACPPPNAAAAGLVVPLNTPTTIDLAASVTGFAITGVAIVAPPGRGTPALNGTKATYTPRHDYFGADAFGYVAFGAGGRSQAAVVSVTVVGRPDPSQDPDVVGLIAAQVETARRFSKAQILNLQRRLESLHGSTGAASASGAPAPPRTATGRDAAPAAAPTPASAPGVHPAALGTVLAALVPAGPLSTFLEAARTRSIELSALEAAALPAGGEAGGTGVWLGGSIDFGRRDALAGQSSLEFSTNGITLGVDRRVDEHLVLGMGLGYARDRSDVGSAGSHSRATGTMLAAYGSYEARPNTFVDALLGYGTLRYDSERFVAPIEELARARRRGDQWFASIAAAYEHRRERLLLSPYARLDLAATHLRATTEDGAGLYALSYFEQRVPTRRLALGLRAETAHQTPFGLARPRLRIEYLREFEADGEAGLAYADQPAGPRYAVRPRTLDRNTLVLAVGGEFLSRDGLALGIEYQVQAAAGRIGSQTILLRLSKELGGKGAAPGRSELAGLSPDPLGLQLDAGLAYDDNVTRGKDAQDRLSDVSLRVNAGKERVVRLGEFTQLALRGSVGAETFRRYSELGRVLAEVQGELMYRASGDFDTPTFSAFARAALDNYRSALRDGHRHALGVSARFPLTDRIGLLGSVAHNVRRGRSRVFDLVDDSLRLNLDYRIGPNGILYLSGEVRHGDTVSSGRPTLENLDIAKVFVADDAFADRALLSYRFVADTRVARIGYSWRLGADNSLDLSWTRSQSSPTDTPAFAGAPSSRYLANQVRCVYLLRY